MSDQTTDSQTSAEAASTETGTQATAEVDATQETGSKLAELEGKYEQQVRDLQTQLEKHKNEAKRWEQSYKTYQQTTTSKLQELSKLRAQVQADMATKAQLARMEAIIGTLSNTVLGDDEKKQLGIELERAKLQAEREQMQVAQQLQNASAIDDPEIYKRQLFETYAPDSALNYDDPRIDWAGDIQNGDVAAWIKRFRSSVLKAEAEDKDAPQGGQVVTSGQQDLAGLLQNEIAALREELKKEVKDEAVTEVRREQEQRLRALGVDVADTARPEGTARPQLKDRITEELDLDLLKTPKGRAEFERRRAAIRTELGITS